MKWILILSALLFVGCSSQQGDPKPPVVDPPVVVTPPTSTPPVVTPPVEPPKLDPYYQDMVDHPIAGKKIGYIDVNGVNRPYYYFAWYPKKSEPTWAETLLKETSARDWTGIKSPCKHLNTADCAAQLLSIMMKYESDFNTNATYAESGSLAGVISSGLLQISIDSSNQKRYDCQTKTQSMLFDPKHNITCGVKILYSWAKQSGELITGDKYGGCGPYWAVCRQWKSVNGQLVEKTSYRGIMTYISGF